MSKKGEVYPTPQKMYVRNPYSWLIDDIVDWWSRRSKTPSSRKQKRFKRKMFRGAVCCFRWDGGWGTRTTQCPTRGSNLMKTENAVQDLPLINEEEEFDLLKEILSKDMEELDKNEGKKRKIKKPTSCPVFWVAISWQKLQNETSCWHPWTRDFKRTHHQRRTSFLPKKCRKRGKESKVVSNYL